jgi:cytidylate kinase
LGGECEKFGLKEGGVMTGKSLEKMVDEQIRKWEIMHGEKKEKEEGISVITISREPGSGGLIVAKEIAEMLDSNLFHQEIIHEMVKSTKVSTMLLETLDEKAFSVLQDWISTMVNRSHLWPDQYLKHLMNVIGTIGKNGRAVVVGRGANFILPPEGRFRVRVVAPQEMRIQNVARDFGVAFDEAKRRVLRTESDRRAFVRKYFHEDITDPVNYDLVLNTGSLSVGAAVKSIKSAIGR